VPVKHGQVRGRRRVERGCVGGAAASGPAAGAQHGADEDEDDLEEQEADEDEAEAGGESGAACGEAIGGWDQLGERPGADVLIVGGDAPSISLYAILCARALGAAFQKVNFLRDLAADFETLGRSYFPGINVDSFTEAEKIRLLDDIDADLAVSAAVVPDLPAHSRRAVALAQSLFAELSVRLRRTPAAELVRARVRVPNPVKARLALAAAIGRTP
jgi:hypothetical protein